MSWLSRDKLNGHVVPALPLAQASPRLRNSRCSWASVSRSCTGHLFVSQFVFSPPWRLPSSKDLEGQSLTRCRPGSPCFTCTRLCQKPLVNLWSSNMSSWCWRRFSIRIRQLKTCSTVLRPGLKPSFLPINRFSAAVLKRFCIMCSMTFVMVL